MPQKPEISIESQPPKITLEYVFDAPSRRVFEAWTSAEQVRCWYRPNGSVVCDCEIDLRVNGKWRIVLRGADGTAQGLGGEFKEIDAPHRLVQSFRYDSAPQTEAVETLTFAERDGKTFLTSAILHKSAENLDWHIRAGVEAAAADMFERLSEHLKSTTTGTVAEAQQRSEGVAQSRRLSAGQIAGSLVAVAVVGGGLYMSLREVPDNAEVATHVGAAAVADHGAAPLTIDVTGRVVVAPGTPIEAERAGTVEAVYCEVGGTVAVGQVCAKLDPQPFQSAVDHEKAALDAAQAKLAEDETAVAEAKAKVDRDQKLARRKRSARRALGASRAAYQRVEARMTSDEAEAARAQAALQAAEANLAKSDIASPIEGIVASRDVEPGRVVDPAKGESDLFSIVANPPFAQIVVKAKGEEASKIAEGDKVSFTVDGIPDRVFQGHVGEIHRAADKEGAGAEGVVIDAPNPDLSLKSGMKAQVKITPARAGADRAAGGS